MKNKKIVSLLTAASVVLFTAAALLAPAACSPAGGPAGEHAAPSVSGALHVEGTKLMDQNGKPVQLRGISTHGIAWFPDYINEACFRQLHEEWGANIMRLAMYTSEYAGYCNGGDQEYLKGLVRDGVAYAAAQDMYVIIDWHILSDSNPNIHKDEAKEFFREMSAEYAGADNVLYEICNEPNGNTSWGEVKEYAEEVIGVIRENDPDAVIIVGTPNWCQYVDQAAADPITDYDNIMYALHFYAATHKQDLRNRMAAALDAGLPIFVSEYGICDASGNGALDLQEAQAWVDLLNERGVSYLVWNLSNKDESSSLIKSSCTKISGFEAEDLSPCGQWIYEMLSGQTLPQEAKAEEPDGEKGAGEETGAAGQAQDAVSINSGDMEVKAELVNSWETEGEPFYQYNLTLTNKGEDCTVWAVDLVFEEPLALSDGWNGDYSVKDCTLHITNKSYNGAVASGETVSDVGFIISGGKTLLPQ